MRTSAPPVDEAHRTDVPREDGYAEWKRAKVERALAESRQRGAMIPAEQV